MQVPFIHALTITVIFANTIFAMGTQPLAPKPKKNWVAVHIRSVKTDEEDDAEQDTWRLAYSQKGPWTVELPVNKNFKIDPSSQDHFITVALQMLTIGLSDTEESLTKRSEKSIAQLSAIQLLCQKALPEKQPEKNTLPPSPKTPKTPQRRARSMSEGGPCTFHYQNNPPTPTRAASVPPSFITSPSTTNQPGTHTGQPPATVPISMPHSPVLILEMDNLPSPTLTTDTQK